MGNLTRWQALTTFLGLAAVGLVVTGRDPRSSEAQIWATSASVFQYHKNPSRDGHYVEPTFTRANAARLQRDPSFQAPLHGPTYAQPLFWAASSLSERDLLFVATEQNDVHALDASTGAVVWRRSLGRPVPRRDLPCGDIDPLGITGTPIIDPASRTLFVAGMTTADGGRTKTHLLAALSIDDGSIRRGWPIDVSRIRAGSLPFTAATQNQRGALALLNGVVYVPYGGHFGDCGDYHGWVVGVSIADPASANAWATRAKGGGIWARRRHRPCVSPGARTNVDRAHRSRRRRTDDRERSSGALALRATTACADSTVTPARSSSMAGEPGTA